MKRTGDEYFDSEEFHELLTEYEHSVETGEPVLLDVDALSEIADYYHYTGRYDQAENAITLALSLSPGAIAPLTYRIHEALWNGKTEEAKVYLSRIVETNELDYVYDKAEIMIAEERVDDADAYFLEILERLPEEDRQDYIFDVANIFQDYSYSEKSMEWTLRAKQEDTPEFKELMARNLFGVGRYKESERIWGELIDSDPFSKHYWNALASAQFMNEDYSSSVQSSEYAIAIDPDDPDGLLQKANGLYYLLNFEEALKYYRRYSSQKPDDEQGLLHQGVCLVNLGRHKEAIEVLNKALEVALSRDPDDESPHTGDIYQELSFAYSEEKDTEKAMEMIEKAHEFDGDSVQTELVKGHIMLASGKMKDAEEYFRRAVLLSDTPNQTLLRVIVSLYDNHYLEAAYTMFKKFFKVVEETPSATECNDGYAYMALCCYDMKRLDEFLSYLKIACERNPRECQVALSHLFPVDVDPKDYYNYIKDRLQ